MQNLITANIVIADRNYRVRIDAADEESVRKIAKLVNEKILEFKSSFAGKDMQDYVSMVLLWFVTEQQQGNISASGITEALNKLEDLVGRENG